MRSAVLWVASFVLVFSCTSRVEKKDSWNIEASKQAYFYPIELEQYFLLPRSCSEEPCISLIDKSSGEVIWTIRDPRFERPYYNMTPYVYGDYVVIPISKELMVVDWKKGELVHVAKSQNYCENHVYGQGRLFFRACYDFPKNKGYVLQYDLKDFRQDSIWSISFRNIAKSLLRSPVPYGDYLVTGSIDHISKQNTFSYFHILDRKSGISRKGEIYPENHLGEGASFSPLVEKNTSYWMVNRDMVRIDLDDGKEQWRKEFPHGLLTSRLSMDDKNLYFPCENEQLYAIDKKNGKIIWQTKIAGTPSRLFQDDIYIYLVGGADQTIYQIIKTNGHIVEKWKAKTGNIDRTSWFGDGYALFRNNGYWQFRKLSENIDVLQTLD